MYQNDASRRLPNRAGGRMWMTVCDSSRLGGGLAESRDMGILGLLLENFVIRCREWWGCDETRALSQSLARKRLLGGRHTAAARGRAVASRRAIHA